MNPLFQPENTMRFQKVVHVWEKETRTCFVYLSYLVSGFKAKTKTVKTEVRKCFLLFMVR